MELREAADELLDHISARLLNLPEDWAAMPEPERHLELFRNISALAGADFWDTLIAQPDAARMWLAAPIADCIAMAQEITAERCQ